MFEKEKKTQKETPAQNINIYVIPRINGGPLQLAVLVTYRKVTTFALRYANIQLLKLFFKLTTNKLVARNKNIVF